MISSQFQSIFRPTLKYQLFHHITTSPDAQINCLVPMNMILYESRTFLLAVLKRLEKSLKTSNIFISSNIFYVYLYFPSDIKVIQAQKNLVFSGKLEEILAITYYRILTIYITCNQ